MREGLIKKALCYSPRYGEIDFTVPIFDSLMKRWIPDLDTPELVICSLATYAEATAVANERIRPDQTGLLLIKVIWQGGPWSRTAAIWWALWRYDMTPSLDRKNRPFRSTVFRPPERARSNIPVSSVKIAAPLMK